MPCCKPVLSCSGLAVIVLSEAVIVLVLVLANNRQLSSTSTSTNAAGQSTPNACRLPLDQLRNRSARPGSSWGHFDNQTCMQRGRLFRLRNLFRPLSSQRTASSILPIL